MFVKQIEYRYPAMQKFTSTVKEFIAGEEGATSVEYAVMLFLIVGACIAAITTVGGESNNMWISNDVEITNALQ